MHSCQEVKGELKRSKVHTTYVWTKVDSVWDILLLELSWKLPDSIMKTPFKSNVRAECLSYLVMISSKLVTLLQNAMTKIMNYVQMHGFNAVEYNS